MCTCYCRGNCPGSDDTFLGTHILRVSNEKNAIGQYLDIYEYNVYLVPGVGVIIARTDCTDKNKFHEAPLRYPMLKTHFDLSPEQRYQGAGTQSCDRALGDLAIKAQSDESLSGYIELAKIAFERNETYRIKYPDLYRLSINTAKRLYSQV